MRLDAATMTRFARHVDHIAEVVHAETGLPTTFHPHCGGWIETPDEVDALLDATNPERVRIVFDTAHYVYGSGRTDHDGQRAVRGLERFWDRIDTIHVKDCSAEIAERSRSEGWNYDVSVRAGLYCELGQGSIDFGAVLATLERFGYQDWLTVEQDVFPNMGTPLESARRNRAFLASLGVSTIEREP
jgi:Sugar phosphate isomerases/epimerases